MVTDKTEDDKGSRGHVFESYDWLTDQIAGRFPPILHLQEEISEAMWPFSNAAFRNADLDDPSQAATVRILNQAINDFLDLFYEAMSGRGRPAARTARSLFEHLVNLRWVRSSPVEAQQYIDHAAIAELLDLELNTVTEDQFEGSTRKRVRHWRHKLERRIRPAADRAIKTHGPWFRSKWTKATLRDRANQVGLGGEYDSYRLLSAVIHGSAGGDFGHRLEIGGEQVLRVGPAVGLAPYALKVGLQSFRELLRDAESFLGPEPVTRLVEVVASLDQELPYHEQLCALVDRDLWPEQAPTSLVFLRVETDGTWKWLLLDGEKPRTIEAEPIDLDADGLAAIKGHVSDMEGANPGRTKPLIVGLPAVKANPKAGAEWEPATETLRRRSLEEADATFTALTVREPLWDPSLHG